MKVNSEKQKARVRSRIFVLTETGKLKKSNLDYTRGMTPKRVTSGGAHLRGSVPGQHSSEETSQRCRVIGDTVSGSIDPGLDPFLSFRC